VLHGEGVLLSDALPPQLLRRSRSSSDVAAPLVCQRPAGVSPVHALHCGRSNSLGGTLLLRGDSPQPPPLQRNGEPATCHVAAVPRLQPRCSDEPVGVTPLLPRQLLLQRSSRHQLLAQSPYTCPVHETPHNALHHYRGVVAQYSKARVTCRRALRLLRLVLSEQRGTAHGSGGFSAT
jgi:hypothetical protein